MDITGKLAEFAEQEHREDILSTLTNHDYRKHYAISVDTMTLFASNVKFAHLLFEFPRKTLKMLNEGFLEAAVSLLKTKREYSEISHVNIHARLTALPNLPEIHRLIFPNCSDVGQFMCLCGTVIRTTAPKVLEYRKMWKCTKCKYTFTVDAEVEKGYVFEKPTSCPNPEWCNGKSFTLLSHDIDPTYCKDYQEIKIQEQAYNLSIGSVPRSVWIILEDDLVDSCQAGNDVIISGVLIQRWKPLVKGNFNDIDLVLLAHNVEVKNKLIPDAISENLVKEFEQFWLEHQSDPLKGRDYILSSICPQIFGLFIVKLAVALTLAGGVEKKSANSRIRGDSHLLLVGDPGTGKSQFLKFASKISMRSVLTSGIGTTNAGLTVSAVKEGGKWQLEAGALVLADGGICCIDEFSCIKEQDKTCIHEAMEQQTISVAKAGLVCRLSTRCSILAATNPKGKYDEQMSLSENTALASPLLSRFDIMLVLLDTHDENWDEMVASYILQGSNLSNKKTNEPVWSVAKMKNYFSLIQYIKPKVTPLCEKVLQAYYSKQRNSTERNFARTTPRLLQSLIRLAEGHAKLMFRDSVLIVDAIIAIILVESSMSGSSILKGLNTLHTSFPDDPKLEYEEKAKIILKLLNLENLMDDSLNYRVDLNTSRLAANISEACVLGKNSPQNISYNLTPCELFQSNAHQLNVSDIVEPQPYYMNQESANNDIDTSIIENRVNVFIKSLRSKTCHDKEPIQNSFKKEQNNTNQQYFDTLHNEITALTDMNNIFLNDLTVTDSPESFEKLFTKKKNSKNKSTMITTSTQRYDSPCLETSEKESSNDINIFKGETLLPCKRKFVQTSSESRNFGLRNSIERDNVNCGEGSSRISALNIKKAAFPLRNNHGEINDTNKSEKLVSDQNKHLVEFECKNGLNSATPPKISLQNNHINKTNLTEANAEPEHSKTSRIELSNPNLKENDSTEIIKSAHEDFVKIIKNKLFKYKKTSHSNANNNKSIYQQGTSTGMFDSRKTFNVEISSKEDIVKNHMENDKISGKTNGSTSSSQKQCAIKNNEQKEKKNFPNNVTNKNVGDSSLLLESKHKRNSTQSSQAFFKRVFLKSENSTENLLEDLDLRDIFDD